MLPKGFQNWKNQGRTREEPGKNQERTREWLLSDLENVA